MLRRYRDRWQLRQLSGKPRVSFLDYVILDQIIKRYFPEPTIPAQRLKELATRIPPWSPPGEDLPQFKYEIQELARLAGSLIARRSSTDDVDADKRDALQLVSQIFYDSVPFQFAKWVLLIALALVGAGSLGIAGFNFLIGERLKSISQELANVEGERAKLKKSQEDAVAEIGKAVAAQQRETRQAFQDQLEQSKRELNTQISEMNRFLTERRSEVEKAVGVAIEAASDAIATKRDAGLEEIAHKAAGELTNLGAAAGESKRIIMQKAVDETANLTTYVNGKKSDLDAASRDLMGRIGNFDEYLRDQRNRAASQVTAMVKDGERLVEQARDKGVTDINAHASTQSNSLKELANTKVREIESASTRGVQALNEALNEKLPELKGKATAAGKQIEAIASDVMAQEQSFITGMNNRLATWDRVVGTEQKRLDDLAKRVPELEDQQKKLGDSLDGIVVIYKPALEVAQSLSEGTWTRDLPLIGRILEKSAALLMIGLALTGLIFLGWLAKLCWWWWNKEAAGAP